MTNHKQNSDDYRTCAAFRDRLPRYATLRALGHPSATIDPSLTAHCVTCAACQAELIELAGLMLTAAAPGDRVVPPTFDLSFLRPPDQAALRPRRVWRIDQLGRFVFTFSQALLEQPSASGFAGAARGHTLYTFDLKLDPPHGFNVLIKVLQSGLVAGTDERLVDVEVNVEVAHASPLDQSGSEVLISSDATQRRDLTNTAGCARFGGLPLRDLSELRVEVVPRPA